MPSLWVFEAFETVVLKHIRGVDDDVNGGAVDGAPSSRGKGKTTASTDAFLDSLT